MRKNKNQRIHLFLFVIIMIILTSACSSLSSNGYKDKTVSNKVEKDSQIRTEMDSKGININKVNTVNIRELTKKFVTALRNEDSEIFKGMIDADGFYAINYFTDGRDLNAVIHLYKDEVEDNLVLANMEKKYGISAGALNLGTAEEIIDMPIHKSELLNNLSFTVNWHTNDENYIETNLEDIRDTLETIILNNNEYVPQVFILKNNMFALTVSILSPDDDPELIGDWVIFEQADDHFIIRALFKFQ